MSDDAKACDEKAKEIHKLKNLRRGKKASITRRINKINQIVSDSGSRTKVSGLLQLLLEVLEKAREDNDAILLLSNHDQDDVEWFQEVVESVDDCRADVAEYLEARKNDDPSPDASETASWVQRYGASDATLPDEDTTFEELSATLQSIATSDGKLLENPPKSSTPIYYTSDIFGSDKDTTILQQPFLGGATFHRPPKFGETWPMGSVTSNPSFSVWRDTNIVSPGSSAGHSLLPPPWRQHYPSSINTHQQAQQAQYQQQQAQHQQQQAQHQQQQAQCQKQQAQHQQPALNQQHHVHHQHLAQPTSLPSVNTAYEGTVPFVPAYGLGGTLRSATGFGGARSRTATSTQLRAQPISSVYVPPSSASHPTANLPAPPITALDPPVHATNQVDAWIDALDENRPNQPATLGGQGFAPDAAMTWLVQNQLPRTQLPTFDGSASDWVEFITKFRDVVHAQTCLNDSQRCLQLLQHLAGEPKRAVTAYSNDPCSYVKSLKRLKSLFGQRSEIARATIEKVTKGKVIESDDSKGLTEFYYSVSDCLVTLRLLCYASDLHSSDTLRQAVRRLPKHLIRKWSDNCVRIKGRSEEPSLIHFENWLQFRVLSEKETSLSTSGPLRRKPPTEERKHINLTRTKTIQCLMCPQKHSFWKCAVYKALSPTKRFDTVKKLKRCLNCFGEHEASKCSSKTTCLSPGCGVKHHTSLHQYYTEKRSKSEKKDGERENGEKKEKDQNKVDVEEPITHNLTTRLSTQRNTFLQVVPVKLSSPAGKTLSTYAILDDCADSSLLREDVATKLGLKGKPVPMRLDTIKDSERMIVSEVQVKISARSGENSFDIDEAYLVPKDKFKMPRQPRPPNYANADMFTHLDGIDLDEVLPSEITILVGADVPEAHIPIDVRRGTPGQPLAVNTPFGWTLFGKNSNKEVNPRISLLQTNLDDEATSSMPKYWAPDEEIVKTVRIQHMTLTPDGSLHQKLERFWVEQHAAIHPPKDIAMSNEDKAAQHTLDTQTRFVDGRYEVPMLWEEPFTPLPNNLHVARKRFQYLVKRLRADPPLYEKYKAIIEGYIANGYCRKMESSEARIVGPKTWYLPHHPVFNPNKPGKVRIVHDPAAEVNGVSLNKRLVTGPDLLNDLNSVLIRFRTGKIAFAADVESFFLRVRVPTSDADSLRFYWTDDIYSDDEPATMQMLVHIFGAKDSANCAIHALRQTARDNHADFDALTFETMLNCFYMDDLLKSVNNVDATVKLVRELIEVCQRGGFRLTKFISNSKRVMESIPPSELLSSAPFSIDSNVERALGMLWDTERDVITYSFTPKDLPPTKRGILGTSFSLYDAPGFLTPFILVAKILLQELWRSGVGWDELVDEATQKLWQRWLNGATKVHLIQIPRCYNPSDEPVEEIQLHLFCDASELAFGAVAYLRVSYKTGGHRCCIVSAKSKLAPIKIVTLPRLELNSAVAAVRLYRTIIRQIDLPIVKVFFWSDSELVLQYIGNNKKRFRVYVANRKAEINEFTAPKDWRHVDGKLNPADLLTRGVNDPTKLSKPNKEGTSFFDGAKFLWTDEHTWSTKDVGELPDNDPEIKVRSVMVSLLMLEDDKTIDATRFSTWPKLKGSTGWMLRFVNNSKVPLYQRNFDETLSCAELQTAEHFILKDMQRVVFQHEFRKLQSKQTLPKTHKLSSLSPFVDREGLLRVGGRLKNASIPDATKHQIILPKDHPVTTLIIRHDHKCNGHIGVEHVLANLRETYWIITGRTAIKSVIRKCFFCQVRRAQMMFPYMADLPAGRVAYGEPPFTNCGVDLFGPITIKQGRKRLKRWVVLYTCLTVRCVHLEVVEFTDTDSFINALRRFVNRRGRPTDMFSDRGTNFVGATTELKDIVAGLKHDEINNFATRQGINWHFNPPAAPHMGGVWERLVRSVKEVMTGLMNNHVLTDPQLYTLLTEVESILNTRPLTNASEDVNDLEALTPNHILLGRHRHWEYMAEHINERDISSRRRYRQVLALADRFWTRWRREYLPDLQKRAIGRENAPNFVVDELVLVSDKDTRRGKWPLGRIRRVMPGDDGVVRTVEVLTKDGLYTRPVVKLCKLEDNWGI